MEDWTGAVLASMFLSFSLWYFRVKLYLQGSKLSATAAARVGPCFSDARSNFTSHFHVVSEGSLGLESWHEPTYRPHGTFVSRDKTLEPFKTRLTNANEASSFKT